MSRTLRETASGCTYPHGLGLSTRWYHPPGIRRISANEVTKFDNVSSCIPCRKRKIRCDKQLPCSNCTKSRNATCLYKDDPRTQRKRGTFGETVQTLGGSGAVVGNPRAAASSSPEPRPPGATRATAAATNTTTLDANTVSTISGTYGNSSCDLPHSSETYVKPLGKPVSAQPASTGESSVNTPVSTLTKNSLVETKTLNFAGKFYFHSEHRHDRQSKSVTRSVSHKTRFFGQSHWVTFMGLVRTAFFFIFLFPFLPCSSPNI